MSEGNVFAQSSSQKSAGSFHFNLPYVSSSFLSIADEQFPQISGFLDETISPSFTSNETVPEENQVNKALPTESPVVSSRVGKAVPDPVSFLQSTISLEDSEPNSTCNTTKDSKEPPDSGLNGTADVPSTKENTFVLSQDVKEGSADGCNVTADIQSTKENTYVVSQDVKEESIVAEKPSQEQKHNSTVEIESPRIVTESLNGTSELVQAFEGPVVKVSTTFEIPSAESLETESSRASVKIIVEPPTKTLEGTMDVEPCERSDANRDPNEAEQGTSTEEANEEEHPGSLSSHDCSRSSIFSVSYSLFTSTPIVFGKESKFELSSEAKAMRKRLSVINSIDARSNDDLDNVSNFDDPGATATTARPVDENKPPSKLPVTRRIPQLSSRLGYPKSNLPTRPSSSTNASVMVKTKTAPVPQAQNPTNPPSTHLLATRKMVHKGKSVAPVRNTAPPSTVKTSVVASVSGYTFTAVAKPSSSGVLQKKPLIHKKNSMKTQQTVETLQTLPCAKPQESMGTTKKTSLVLSGGLKRLKGDESPSAKRKRPGSGASVLQCNAQGAHVSECINCSHEEAFEKVLQELERLRSECKKWGPEHEKKIEACLRK
ncbi:hypothetical protein DNTS_024173 [Danionella cerebrum]|uniref:Uncharacterized protein n=1 Tax=Danionella cerebrum TaxID=2873325 RepID=A0A553RIK0_9TELE|nr:hypothetical protein DNTS_024173 [Danionella translucida]